MKNCPDTDRLLDLLDPDTVDPEVLAHLQTCPSCRAELRILRDIPAAFAEPAKVPAHLILRAKAAIDEVAGPRVEQQAPGKPGSLELTLVGLLGTLTAFAVVVGTGVPEGASLISLVAYSGVLGIGAVLLELRKAGRFGDRGMRPSGR